MARARSKRRAPAPPVSEVAAATGELRRYLRRSAHTIGWSVGLIWGAGAVNLLLFAGSLNAYGIVPRTVRGLIGIPLAPLLHGGVFHLISNTVGMLLLGGLVVLREERHYWVVTLTAWLLGGLGVWTFGRPSVHIGISGVIFGYLGYLLLTGWFERRVGSILLSVAALLLWAPMLLGMLPVQVAVSWESHVFGFLSGVLAAWWLARPRRKAA
jgi:membrane associated rhomboid family serine protease